MAKRVKINYLGYLEEMIVPSDRIYRVWQAYKEKAPGTMKQKAYRFCKAHGFIGLAFFYTYPDVAEEVARIAQKPWLGDVKREFSSVDFAYEIIRNVHLDSSETRFKNKRS